MNTCVSEETYQSNFQNVFIHPPHIYIYIYIVREREDKLDKYVYNGYRR